MKQVKILVVVLVLAMSVLSAGSAKAQCAQCSATVESNNSNGGKQGNGLNHGIMYLLAAPYLVIAAGGYIWYKKYRRKNLGLNIRDQKLNLN